MKWNNQENDAYYQRTTEGERAHRYYYVYATGQEGAGKWIAGRYTFGREYDYRGKTFPDSATARAYCEKIDRDAVVIEGVSA